MNKDKKKQIYYYFLVLYIIVWQIMTIVYWYEYSEKHSFWNTVLWGFFVSELKGVIWIFLIW
jgi:hypothetical protein